MIRALGLSALLALAACAAPMRHSPPELAAARALPATYGEQGPGVSASDLASWWRRFDDPALDALADLVLAANQDIEQAAARIDQARARVHGAAGARLPSLAATLGAGRQVAGTPLAGGATEFSGDVSLAWNPDVFGELREGHRAAAADFDAAGFDLAAVQRLAVGEMALNYVQYRAFGQRLAATNEALAKQRTLLDVIDHRAAIGVAVAADVEQARLLLLQVEALGPELEQARRQSANRIVTLAGGQAQAVRALLDRSTALPATASLPGAGIPADLLRRRPDLRAAEARVMAAAATRGAARAGMLPNLSLGGILSGGAFSLPGFASSLAGNLVAQLTQALFDGGQARALADEQQGRVREAIAAYRGAVLIALEDVENALAAVTATDARVDTGAAALDAAQRNAALARGQYEIGLSNLFILLDADQQLLAQRDALITARADRAAAAIQLYLALGGGW